VSKELSQRLLISCVGIPVLLIIYFKAGIPLFVLLGLIALFGAWEYNNILTKHKSLSCYLTILVSFLLFVITALPVGLSYSTAVVINSLTALAGINVLLSSSKGNKDRPLRDYLLTLGGWIYTGVLPGLIFRLGSAREEYLLLFLLAVFIWLTDSAAYFIGVKFGRHRGIFPVSPNKSLEGYIAGLVMPCFLVIILYYSVSFWTIRQLVFTAVCAGLFGQWGDLLESKIKRTGGVKDSSNLIPGHGGVLDRFDSLLLAGPVLYVLLIIIP